jgi:general secretion pathway protein F
MPTFAFTAFNNEGRQISGRIDADDLDSGRRKLRSQGLSVAHLTQLEPFSRRSGLKMAVKLQPKFNYTRFFCDLSVLLNAGLGIDQALRAMTEVAGTLREREIIKGVLDKLSSGAGPADALSSVGHLPEDLIAVVASGERSARLPYVVGIVASDLTRRDEQRKKLIDAAVYPSFLVLMLVIAIGIITFVLVPTLQPIFESSGRDMPMIIIVLSRLREVLSSPLIFMFVATSVVTAIAIASFRPNSTKRYGELCLLKMPLVHRVVRGTALARYLHSLALLLENSVPLPEALSLAARCCPINSFHDRLSRVAEAVSLGKRLPVALANVGLFPASVISLVAIGDEVNKLPAVLFNASTISTTDAQRMTDRIMALMTPVITISLGAIIGGLVISVMSALLSINELSVN